MSQSVLSSMTVMSFTGVDTTGVNGAGAIGMTGTGNGNPGLPTASLVTTLGGSLVLGVGNDWDKAVARTPGPGQVLVNQYFAPVGDTYWVQRQNSPTPTAGTTVTINDTAPSTDRYNLTIVEVLAAAVVNATPDLSITKTHAGTFVQGQTGANYAITVTNSGGAATSGTVTVNDTLPASLTATAISGTGWSCTTAPALGCSRNDSLGGGASYPMISLTVNVASNAPASVTNTATVSGGGETNTSNDTANDVTAITTPPDLTITKNHSGSFTQGQTGASYAITVTNSGGAATSGTVMATFRSQASVTGPNVSMTSPAPNATATGNTNVSATATDQSSSITGVQFLLDGSNLGAQVTSPPYSLTWNTTTTTAGVHTLSATVFDSAGLSASAAPITVTVDNSGNPAVVGSWSAPVTTPTVAVNLVLLKNGNVLFYQDGVTPTVWNYTTNVFTNTATSANLFCSGHAALSDGRILVVGGYGGSGSTIGIANAEIFDPSNNTWSAVPNMAFKRWYPTATTLSDGRILVTAGWQTTNHTNAGIPEIYDPVANTWTQLTNANNPFETYPFMFLLPDGRLIHTGGSEYAANTDVLDINAQTWTVLDSRIVDGGSATMYSPGLILKAGSAADSQNAGPSSNTTFLLDTTQSSPAWQQAPSMAYPRSFFNLTTLPDGTVLASGGETDKNGGNISNAVYAAELWSPRTLTWTTMASMHTPREYHGTALLLPDGRVLQSGMGADFGNVPDQLSAEFYSPPYLFKGARPAITQSPAGITYGQNFFVGTPDGATITSAVLIRTGAVTHFFDENTRFVPVTFTQAAGGLTITAPANGNQAPPGYYMLFLVNSSGVPSIAPILQLHP